MLVSRDCTALLALLLACIGAPSADAQTTHASHTHAGSAQQWPGEISAEVHASRPPTAWSAPVNVGPAVNSAYKERFSSISHDGLSLYFSSDRPRGGGTEAVDLDIYVSHRASVDAPWEEPKNLGGKINSSAGDHSVTFSPDGHWMYFASDRPGGCGGDDLYRSYRKDANDDFGWEEPVHLGCVVNSPESESCPVFRVDPENGAAKLYFVSDRPGGTGSWDIFVSSLDIQTGNIGPAIPVEGVNSPEIDGHFDPFQPDEALIWTNRSGGFGKYDFWASIRDPQTGRWSTPVNLGPEINTEYSEEMPSTPADGQSLFLVSNRPGGIGSYDIYVSARKPSRP